MSGLSENEIRPKKLFEKYLELSRIDGDKLDKSQFLNIACTGCGSKNLKSQFHKNGYEFKACDNCQSLFCSPRPTQEQLNQLYIDSPSSTFWSNDFFPTVAEDRREKLFKPKAKEIVTLIQERKLEIKSICDVGAGHGYLLEEIQNLAPNIDFFAIEPDKTSAEVCRSKGITVLETVSEEASEWSNRFDLVVSFEVIEHVFSPQNFITSLSNLTKPEGFSLITGLGYEGFDILTLQKGSNSVSAPHHLNFHSIEGFKKLFLRSGFSDVDVWTPGNLDIDIVLNSGYYD